MRRATLFLATLVLVLSSACRTTRAPAGGDDQAGAPVIKEPTLVAFTLPASDTLKAGEEREGLEDFRRYTAMVVPLLADEGILFQTTTADSIIIERSDGIRRVVMLRGLDYPYGYVLIEPGYAESILTGVLTDSELADEVDWYFGTSEESDGEDDPRRVTLRGTTPPAAGLPG